MMSKNILHTILETKRKEVAELRSGSDLELLKAQAQSRGGVRDFFAAVTKPPLGLANLIAEVKKASPSAGVIRADFDPVAIARKYAEGGANAISVLTDRQYFQGSLEYLKAVKQAVDLPVLRKDFIIDPLQVYESRAAGADAILLIAAALDAEQLKSLATIATGLGMTVLVEVHNPEELSQVKSVIDFRRRCLLGINNRDLTTFKVDINATVRLAEQAGEGISIVSESGIKTRQDVETLRGAGVKAILVGETLMRCKDTVEEIKELLRTGV